MSYKKTSSGIRLLMVVYLRPRLLLLVSMFLGTTVFALGNYPEAGVCPADKPFFAFCTHSLHNLEGWHGRCYGSRDLAQLDADEHVKNHHSGNSRWTGVMQSKTHHNVDAGG